MKMYIKIGLVLTTTLGLMQLNTTSYAQKKASKNNVQSVSNIVGNYINGSQEISIFADKSYIMKDGVFYNSGVFTNSGKLLSFSNGQKFKITQNAIQESYSGIQYVKSGMIQNDNTSNTKVDAASLSKLTAGKWVLVELFGKKIEHKEGNFKEAFIAFKKDDKTFYGNTGCNSFGGSIEILDGFKIKFGQSMQTMMACLGLMDQESEFNNVLNTADNYTIANGILSLNKARMAPMAKFKLVK